MVVGRAKKSNEPQAICLCPIPALKSEKIKVTSAGGASPGRLHFKQMMQICSAIVFAFLPGVK